MTNSRRKTSVKSGTVPDRNKWDTRSRVENLCIFFPKFPWSESRIKWEINETSQLRRLSKNQVLERSGLVGK